jgi:serine/threonine-protein kinase
MSSSSSPEPWSQARWQAADALLDAALDLAPSARAAYLDAHCPDADLRREVEALLALDAADAASGAALDRALDAGAVAFADARPDRLGAYRLGAVLGRGGMGTVYRATRADGAFAHAVAVKVLHAGATPDLVRRFEAERQILARLTHPHVARVFDGGTTPPAPGEPDGRPYFVMELVEEGVPITAYADAARLPVRDRLRLVADVAEAVRHAHGRLVIHRDLKPSNVLVRPPAAPDEPPQVKLLDFGIAKVLGGAATPADATHVHTQPGRAPLTPAYAAPEQRAGAPADVTTDVYGLGAILYHLLAGRPPHDDDAGRGAGTGTDATYAPAPPAPSTVVARAPDAEARAEARRTRPAALVRTLRGDLDTLVQTALHRDPARRYASADALLADLRRYLDGLPLRARPDTPGYRARRFVQRHRWGVGVAVACVLTLVVSLGLALAQARRADRARLRADADRARAEAVSGFVLDLFGAAYADPDHLDGAPGSAAVAARQQAALTLLAPATDRLRRDTTLAPLTRATMLHTLGDVYRDLGVVPRADSLLRAVLPLARAPGRLAGDGEEDASAVRLRADAWHSLGLLYALERGQRDTAHAYFARADSLRRLHLAADHPDRLESLFWRVNTEPPARPGHDARIDRVVARHRAVYGDDSPEVAGVMNLFGQSGRGDLLRASLTRYRALYGDRHPLTAALHNNVALLLEAPAPDTARLHIRRAVDGYRHTLGPNHPTTLQVERNEGAMLLDAGDPAAADRVLDDVLARARRVYPEGSSQLTRTLFWSGRAASEAGRAEVGLRRLRRAYARYRAVHPGDHLRVLEAQHTLGAALRRAGQPAEAARLLRAAERGLAARLAAARRAAADTSWYAAHLRTTRADLAALSGTAPEASGR